MSDGDEGGFGPSQYSSSMVNTVLGLSSIMLYGELDKSTDAAHPEEQGLLVPVGTQGKTRRIQQ